MKAKIITSLILTSLYIFWKPTVLASELNKVDISTNNTTLLTATERCQGRANRGGGQRSTNLNRGGGQRSANLNRGGGQRSANLNRERNNSNRVARNSNNNRNRTASRDINRNDARNSLANQGNRDQARNRLQNTNRDQSRDRLANVDRNNLNNRVNNVDRNNLNNRVNNVDRNNLNNRVNNVNRNNFNNRVNNIDRNNFNNRVNNIDRNNFRNRLDNTQNIGNRVRIGDNNVVINPRGWSNWGWNGGIAWNPVRTYWGGGFWGPFAVGAVTGLATGALLNYNNPTIINNTKYVIVQNDSPGFRLLNDYGLTQTQCQGNVVIILGPNDSVICAYPNDWIPAGLYGIDPISLSLIPYF